MKQLHARLDLIRRFALCAAEDQCVRIFDLIIKELAEVFLIHLALVHIDHGAAADELQLIVDGRHSFLHIGELAHAAWFDDDPVRMIIIHHFLQRGLEIAG